MLKHVLLASAALALLAAPGFAVASPLNVTTTTLNGTVGLKCSISAGPSSVDLTNGGANPLIGINGHADITPRFVPLVNQAWCNGAANSITVNAVSLTNDQGHSIDYKLSNDSPLPGSVLSTAGSGTTAAGPTVGPFESTGVWTGKVELIDNNSIVPAGGYTGSITVTFNAN